MSGAALDLAAQLARLEGRLKRAIANGRPVALTWQFTQALLANIRDLQEQLANVARERGVLLEESYEHSADVRERAQKGRE